ncbi:uncharacterized protein LOC114789821 [Denticeps clupeoides]|uniref:uncharacterized protein LOC114789821 n=1 Tax=Denticeps clupeoides TaxID=299321 RepID=UPI0010A574FE|nr:uncharacterized protein LOC114789821 [Denticeps clupeoides]
MIEAATLQTAAPLNMGRTMKILNMVVVFLLVVTGNPADSNKMQMVTADFGSSVVLTCDLSGYELTSNERLDISWETMGEKVAQYQFGNISIGLEFEGRVASSFSPAGSFNVTLDSVVLSDSEMYECLWDDWKTLATVVLAVEDPRPPRFIEAEEGSAVQLPCFGKIFKSKPVEEITVEWQHNKHQFFRLSSGELVMTREAYMGDEGQVRLGNLSLTIPDIKPHHQGTYNCLYHGSNHGDLIHGIPDTVTLIVTGSSGAMEEPSQLPSISSGSSWNEDQTESTVNAVVRNATVTTMFSDTTDSTVNSTDYDIIYSSTEDPTSSNVDPTVNAIVYDIIYNSTEDTTSSNVDPTVNAIVYEIIYNSTEDTTSRNVDPKVNAIVYDIIYNSTEDTTSSNVDPKVNSIVYDIIYNSTEDTTSSNVDPTVHPTVDDIIYNSTKDTTSSNVDPNVNSIDYDIIYNATEDATSSNDDTTVNATVDDIIYNSTEDATSSNDDPTVNATLYDSIYRSTVERTSSSVDTLVDNVVATTANSIYTSTDGTVSSTLNPPVNIAVHPRIRASFGPTGHTAEEKSEKLPEVIASPEPPEELFPWLLFWVVTGVLLVAILVVGPLVALGKI